MFGNMSVKPPSKPKLILQTDSDCRGTSKRTQIKANSTSQAGLEGSDEQGPGREGEAGGRRRRRRRRRRRGGGGGGGGGGGSF